MILKKQVMLVLPIVLCGSADQADAQARGNPTSTYLWSSSETPERGMEGTFPSSLSLLPSLTSACSSCWPVLGASG